MDSKIRELTSKLYEDGVQKGTLEAEKIISDAKAKSEDIVANAIKEAEKEKKKIHDEAEELLNKTKLELLLYAKQMVDSIKKTVADTITTKVVSDSVLKVCNETDILYNVIVELAKNFDLSKGVEITSSQSEKLRTFFENKAKELLNSGLSIVGVNGNESNFTIGPSDGSYKIQFGVKEFEELFVSFLRPQMAKMLFEK